MFYEKLQNAREYLEDVRGKEAILSAAARGIGKPEKDFEYFSFNINNHRYRGWIYKARDEFMGSLFYQWDNNIPQVIRGFPKIRYVEDTRLWEKKVTIEEKLDGTNLLFWQLPNGLMGKTRMVPRYDIGGWNGREWDKLSEKTGYLPNIEKLTKKDYAVIGELYGYLNECEFVKYTIPIDIKILDIIDLKTFKFLEPKEKRDLASRVGLKCADVQWEGKLDRNNYVYMVNEAERMYRQDGYEGFIAKYYEDDQYFAKIKCEDVRQRAILLAGGGLVPKQVINKAVRKTFENSGLIDDHDEFISMVNEELLEDWEKEFVERSQGRISKIVDKKFPIHPKEIWNLIDKIRNEGVDVSNIDETMSALAKRFDIVRRNPSFVYQNLKVYKKQNL